MPAPEAVPRFTPLRLPRLSRAQARVANRIVQRAHALPVLLDGQPWCLTLSPAPLGLAELGAVLSAASPAPLAPLAPDALDAISPLGPALVAGTPDWDESLPWCIDTRWGDTPYRLWLPKHAVQAWVSHTFPDLDLPALPQPFLAAVLETTGRAVLAQLAELGRGPLRVLRIECVHPDTHGQEETWRLQLKSDTAQLEGWLTTSPAGLMHLASFLRDWEPAAGPLAGLHGATPLPLTLRAEVGYTFMTVAEWADLQPGDAILVERPLLAPDGELWLACGNAGLRARPEGAQLRVTSTWKRGAWAMDPFDDEDPCLSPLDALRQVPMRVAFDVGELRLTIADLEALQVGQALDLGRPLSEAVQIRVNGARVGHGELVDIDGRLGVVLRTLSARDLSELAISQEDAAVQAGASDWEERASPGLSDSLSSDVQGGDGRPHDLAPGPWPDLPPAEA